MNKETGQFLAKQLYPDLKGWVTSLSRGVKASIAKARAEIYQTPDELLEALKTASIKNNDLVTLECKPSLFGPFLRNHFLSNIIGHHTNMRLGPPLLHPNPVLGMMAQVTSHLKPVGLYPPIDADVFQASLYPSDTIACGFISLFPGINDLVNYIPALLASRHIPYCGMACNVTGTIRLIDPQSLIDFGVRLEDYEEIRQAGRIWFFDATGDDSECIPLGDAVTTELWGGLYASGHLEIVSGSLKLDRIVAAMREAMDSEGFASRVTQNQAGRKEIMMYDRGIRILLDSTAPLFSLHMDSEIGIDFKGARRKFDSVSQSCLTNIGQVCQEDSVELDNELDLDFSYTDASRAFTVLKSKGANFIEDPLAIAIRDWHRQRGA